MYRVKAIKFKVGPRPTFMTINGAICYFNGKPVQAADIVPGEIVRCDISQAGPGISRRRRRVLLESNKNPLRDAP